MIEYNERINEAIIKVIKKHIQKYDAEIADIIIKKIPEFKYCNTNPDSVRRTVGRFRKRFDLKADRINLSDYLKFMKEVYEKNQDKSLASIANIVRLKYSEYSYGKIWIDLQRLAHGRIDFKTNQTSYVRKSRK